MREEVIVHSLSFVLASYIYNSNLTTSNKLSSLFIEGQRKMSVDCNNGDFSFPEESFS